VTIRVLRPGLFTTVQDAGRHGLQHLGLCPGGAMDDIALALANALVGNAPGEAALEVTVIGPELEFERDCLVAVCGAEFRGAFPHNRPLLVRAGERYSVGRAVRGARAYVAVAGGFPIEPVLGSRSTYLPGAFGGLEGRALRHGDVLPLHPDAADLSARRFSALKNRVGSSVRWSAPPLTLPDREPVLIHVIEGQHHASFEPASQREFVDAVWRIAPESNRMGFRLQGPALQRMKGAGGGEILSGPTCLGSVQVPAGGAPIALMADHQTTGGYPRIAEVCSADVPRLAQLAPGGKVHFAHCSLETAAELRSHMQERLNTALRGIAWSYGS
jgi:antagonist of KipI